MGDQVISRKGAKKRKAGIGNKLEIILILIAINSSKKTYRKLKRSAVVILILLAAFFIYVEIANRNSKHMTYRQKFLKAVYPVWMWWGKLRGKNAKAISAPKTTAIVPFYSLKGILNNGTELDLAQFKGKKLLLVNTASNCGYTDQYNDLEKIIPAASRQTDCDRFSRK